MEHRLGRPPVLSPLEESSEEVSRDSGIVSQSASTVSMLSEGLSNGNVSQSPSFGLNVSQSPSFAGNVSESPSFAGNVLHSPSLDGAAAQSPVQEQEDEILRQTALSYSSYIRADAGEEVSNAIYSGGFLRVPQLLMSTQSTQLPFVVSYFSCRLCPKPHTAVVALCRGIMVVVLVL